ncbi:MAG: hypothetical protein RLZZ246_1940, partial [Planctomycetota bacterium]
MKHARIAFSGLLVSAASLAMVGASRAEWPEGPESTLVCMASLATQQAQPIPTDATSALHVASIDLADQRLRSSGFCASDATRLAWAACGVDPAQHDPRTYPQLAAAQRELSLNLVVERLRASGTPPVDLMGLACVVCAVDPVSLGLLASPMCAYYIVDAYSCNGSTMIMSSSYAGTICIEKAIGLCTSPSCAPGQRAFYKLQTPAGCDPSSACVFLEIRGP